MTFLLIIRKYKTIKKIIHSGPVGCLVEMGVKRKTQVGCVIKHSLTDHCENLDSITNDFPFEVDVKRKWMSVTK